MTTNRDPDSLPDRDEVARRLRRMGYPQTAEAAVRELPDRVDREHAARFCRQHGLFLDDLIDHMGGSP